MVLIIPTADELAPELVDGDVDSSPARMGVSWSFMSFLDGTDVEPADIYGV